MTHTQKFAVTAGVALVAAVAMVVAYVPMTAGATGNGAPSGAHYNLNIIGVPKGKTADMTGNSGHRIFVPLVGKTNIWLCESGVDAACAGVDGFQVLDANGTDGSASFALPNPDPDGDGTTVYSVFARALGKPGGSSVTTTCATGPGADGVLGTGDDETLCSVISMELTRDKGKSTFDNVSKYLLYIYADVDGDGNLERVPLFGSQLEDYFWEYDNHGLKLAQLRFYECATIVPDASDPNGAQIDTACFQ
ncbi:MAG: hypothetical protein AAB804_00550 [Patescibacteria group bacterium]